VNGPAAIDARLANEVVDRLGLSGVDHDDDGVATFYAAWCRSVPFDNLRKLPALRAGTRPLPGDTPDDFFRAWLDHGTGGTCWASSGALGSLAASLGFDAALVVGSMLDLPEPNHGSVVIDVEGTAWLTDSSLLTGAPHRLVPEGSRTDAGGYRSRIEPDGDTWMMVTDTARGELPCRLHPGVRTADEYRERHERTRGFSVFNEAPYVLRHLDGRVQCLIDRTLTVWSDEGPTATTFDDDARREWLRTAGFSDGVVADALGDSSQD
jgi:N-hydroxyarylamine O-acetyltransferase